VREAEHYVIRDIPRVYLCGQQEPMVEVFGPDTKELSNFVDRLFRHCLIDRLFRARGGDTGNKKKDQERSVSLLDFLMTFDSCKLVMNDLRSVLHARLREVAVETTTTRYVLKRQDELDMW